MADKVRDVRVFVDSGMNLDSEERLLKPNEYRECWNSIVNVSDSNGLGCLENIKGTVSVFDLPINAQFLSGFPTGTLRCNGGCKDEQENAIIYFLCDTTTTNHSIMRMFNDNYRCEWVYKAEPLLNFKIGSKIKSAFRIGDLNYWTDGYEGEAFVDSNSPRKTNIIKATAYTNQWEDTNTYHKGDIVGTAVTKKAYRAVQDVLTQESILDTDYWEEIGDSIYSALTLQILERIKYPPKYQPTMSYESDTTVRINNLRNNLFQSAYRWVYDDNEKSVFSPFSDIMLPTSLESLNGSTDDDPTIDNYLKIWVNNGSEEVRAVEIAVRKGNSGVWVLVHRREKDYSDINIQHNIYWEYNFYNNELGEPLDQEDVERLFDAVPQISENEELIEKNRIIDANYTEGYDNLDIDVELTSTQTEVVVGKVGGNISGALCWSKRQFIALQFIGLGDVAFKYYGGTINLMTQGGVDFWEPGFTYVFNISALPGIYDDPENLGGEGYLQMIYQDDYRKPINAHATVDAPIGMSFNTFCDSVVLQLRSGSSYGVVVGLNNSNYKTFSLYSSMYDFDNGNTSPVVPDGHLGFIIEFAGSVSNGWGTCINCGYVEIDILKISGETVVQSFKSGAWHPFGLIYKDAGGRRCMVQKSDTSKIFIKAQNDYGFPHQIYQNVINWEINHVPPIWADEVQWVYGKNTSVSYFLFASIQAISNLARTGNLAASNCTSICINEYIVETSEILTKFNVSTYAWESGDRLRFVFGRQSDNTHASFGTYLDFEILGTYYQTGDSGYEMDTATSPKPITDANGNKVRTVRGVTLLIDKIDFVSYGITADDTIVEIYRPKKITENLIYLDIGNALPILDPHTDARRHSGTKNDQVISTDPLLAIPAAGTFSKGDVYIAFRNMHNAFPVERPNFSDFFDSSCFGIGKANIADVNAKRQKYIAQLLYSQIYIQNTLTNGLSKVNSSDKIELAEKWGEINFVKEVGFTLKILQKYKPSAIYIGRAGLTQADISKGEILFANDKTLGTVVVSDSDFGTLHGTSVSKHEKSLYWYDINSGCIVRDGANGIFPISDYGVKDFIRDKSRIFINTGVDVYSVYDEFYNLVIFAFVDQTVEANSFTIGFHEPTNKWISFYGFTPDWLESMKITTTSFDPEGKLWIHNQGTRMNFYGVQKTQSVKIVTNAEPLRVKILRSMALDSNKVWDVKSIAMGITENYKRGIFSIIPKSWFTAIEGKWYSTFGKNMLTNGVQNYNDLINGDELRGSSAEIELENTDTDETKLFGVIINSTYSAKSG